VKDSWQKAAGSGQEKEDRGQKKELRIADLRGHRAWSMEHGVRRTEVRRKNCGLRIADLKTKRKIKILLWERLSAAILRFQLIF
jgi:hypothetical protein